MEDVSKECLWVNMDMKTKCNLENISDDEDVQILATHGMLLMSAKGSK